MCCRTFPNKHQYSECRVQSGWQTDRSSCGVQQHASVGVTNIAACFWNAVGYRTVSKFLQFEMAKTWN